MLENKKYTQLNDASWYFLNKCPDQSHKNHRIEIPSHKTDKVQIAVKIMNVLKYSDILNNPCDILATWKIYFKGFFSFKLV